MVFTVLNKCLAMKAWKSGHIIPHIHNLCIKWEVCENLYNLAIFWGENKPLVSVG